MWIITAPSPIVGIGEAEDGAGLKKYSVSCTNHIRIFCKFAASFQNESCHMHSVRSSGTTLLFNYL
jgi:hypothetical protein